MLNLTGNAAKNAVKTRRAHARTRAGLGLALPSFTVAELNGADFNATKFPGAIVSCSNGNAGAACLAFSNGTNWVRIALGAAIATV